VLSRGPPWWRDCAEVLSMSSHESNESEHDLLERKRRNDRTHVKMILFVWVIPLALIFLWEWLHR
jgi:hypothetical protein